MAINITKVKSTEEQDFFTYRDIYNDEQIVVFPKAWNMTEKEVEEYGFMSQ